MLASDLAEIRSRRADVTALQGRSGAPLHRTQAADTADADVQAYEGTLPLDQQRKRMYPVIVDENSTKRPRKCFPQLPEDGIVRVSKHLSVQDLSNSHQICQMWRRVIYKYGLELWEAQC